MATIIPSLFASPSWYSLSYIAKRLNIPARTAQHWARSGLFTRMGIKVIIIPATGWSGRAITWLYLPEPSKYAMLRSLPLDIPLANDLGCKT